VAGLFFVPSTPIFSIQTLAMLVANEHFIRHEYISLLLALPADTPPLWGKMDVQQMIEHIRDAFKVANGRLPLPLVNTDPDQLAKARAFMLSDQPFRENTKMPLMPEEPRKHKYASKEEAVEKLIPEVDHVFAVYAATPGLRIMSPMFGELNYEEQLHLLNKHARHHLRQFGVTI
jgi:hypothetical protein